MGDVTMVMPLDSMCPQLLSKVANSFCMLYQGYVDLQVGIAQDVDSHCMGPTQAASIRKRRSDRKKEMKSTLKAKLQVFNTGVKRHFCCGVMTETVD